MEFCDLDPGDSSRTQDLIPQNWQVAQVVFFGEVYSMPKLIGWQKKCGKNGKWCLRIFKYNIYIYTYTIHR